MSHPLPPAEPARHGIAELLTLMTAVRRLNHDTTLPPVEALGRTPDAFHEYDENRGGDRTDE